MDLLESTVVAAVYPGGTDEPSVTGRDVVVGQGWPLAKDVDNVVARAGKVLVSIYAEPSTTSPSTTPINRFYTVATPAPGTVVVARDPEVTVGGNPTLGDVVVLFLDGRVYPYPVQVGDTPQIVVSALLALVLPSYPDTKVDGSGTTMTILSAGRVGIAVSAPGKTARKVHTQRSQFQIVVWAPNPADRTAVAVPIDVAVKSTVRRPMSDTTSVLLSYQGTNLRDKEENEGVFRRDVLVNAVYETIELVSGQSVVAPLVTTST